MLGGGADACCSPALEEVGVLLRGVAGAVSCWAVVWWTHLGASIVVLEGTALLLVVAAELCFQKRKKTAACSKCCVWNLIYVFLACMDLVLSEAVFLCCFCVCAIERGAGSLARKYAICELSSKLLYQCWLLPGEMIPIYHSLREKRLGSSWMFQSRMKNEHEDS